jgi:hypothetical protein
MKLRIEGTTGLFDADLLVDAPDCSDLGYRAALKINWPDGEKVWASPTVAAKRCTPVWATPDEWHSLTEFGFLPSGAEG